MIAGSPWPTGWVDWRPPEEWGPLGLPRDWHVVRGRRRRAPRGAERRPLLVPVPGACRQDTPSCPRRTSRPARSPDFPPASGRRGRAAPVGRQSAWEGNGVLMLQRPGEAHAIWVFWFGEEREFHGWYVNLQEPFRRTRAAATTRRLELDISMPVDGRGSGRTPSSRRARRRGRFTPEQADCWREEGRRVGRAARCRRAAGGTTAGQPGGHRRAGTVWG